MRVHLDSHNSNLTKKNKKISSIDFNCKYFYAFVKFLLNDYARLHVHDYKKTHQRL
jgi:hypothetical protein